MDFGDPDLVIYALLSHPQIECRLVFKPSKESLLSMFVYLIIMLLIFDTFDCVIRLKPIKSCNHREVPLGSEQVET